MLLLKLCFHTNSNYFTPNDLNIPSIKTIFRLYKLLIEERPTYRPHLRENFTFNTWEYYKLLIITYSSPILPLKLKHYYLFYLAIFLIQFLKTINIVMQILFKGYSSHVKYNHIKLKTVRFGEVSSIQHCEYIIYSLFLYSDW